MQKLTIDKIAELAFVSRSVVSRVINNRPNVSAEARDRVLQVIKKYNYTPSAVARSLATDRTFEISIVAPRKRNAVFANGFWSLLLLGISEQCNERGYFVSLSVFSETLNGPFRDRILHGHNFDGHILISSDVSAQVIPVLRTRNLPVVLIGSNPAFPSVSSVDASNEAGGYQATRHLIDLGHREIAVVAGPLQAQETIDRLSGYRRAMYGVGHSVRAGFVVEADYSQRGGYEATRSLLAAAPQPTAIFYVNDAMATGGMLALHEAGRLIPNDVAVVGYDDLPTTKYLVPPLTTVRQPIYRMGEAAANMVIDQIERRPQETEHAFLDTRLVIRQSCGACRDAQDPEEVSVAP